MQIISIFSTFDFKSFLSSSIQESCYFQVIQLPIEGPWPPNFMCNYSINIYIPSRLGVLSPPQTCVVCDDKTSHEKKLKVAIMNRLTIGFWWHYV
jgi:hypothetical protein